MKCFRDKIQGKSFRKELSIFARLFSSHRFFAKLDGEIVPKKNSVRRRFIIDFPGNYLYS
jgi:hypothetical protein